MSSPEPTAEGAAGALTPRSLLEALPSSVVVVDGVGTLLFVTEAAARIVGRSPSELEGHSVLEFVTPDFAWAYASAVAMAGDYRDVTMGPLRVEFVRPDDSIVSAVLWAENRLDDPEIGGIVCVLTQETVAMGLTEAVTAVAATEPVERVALLVAQAMTGAPVQSDAVVVVPNDHDWHPLVDTALDPRLCGADPDGPWEVCAHTGIRALHPTLDTLPTAVADAAAAAGYAACWAEPVATPDGRVRAVVVIWRHRPGGPSPNQVTSVFQAASILALSYRLDGS